MDGLEPQAYIPAEYDDIDEEPEIRLKSGIDLNDLRAGKDTTFEIEDEDAETKTAKEYFSESQVYSGTGGQMPNFFDLSEDEDESDDEKSPFEQLAAKMFNITEDGGVKKRIKKQGFGGELKEGYVVQYHFQMYTEFVDDPIDSSVLRNRKEKIILGRGKVVPGLDIALLSMKRQEQAQFLIQPHYAFGDQGCEPRIPKKATLKLNVELLDAAESAGADEYFMMEREERKELELKKILKYIRDEIKSGKEFFREKAYGRAVARYKKCLSMLQERVPKDEEEEKQMQKEEVKLNNNLAVVHLKQNSLGQVIYYANNTLAIEPKNAKALYLKGKALMKKGDFSRSRECLSKAQFQAPGDKDIAEAIRELDKAIKKWNVLEKNMYQKMFNSNDSKTGTDEMQKLQVNEVNTEPLKAEGSGGAKKNIGIYSPDEFRESVEEVLRLFVEDDELVEMPYPKKDLTLKEIDAVLEIVQAMGLQYKHVGEGSNEHLLLMKTTVPAVS